MPKRLEPGKRADITVLLPCPGETAKVPACREPGVVGRKTLQDVFVGRYFQMTGDLVLEVAVETPGTEQREQARQDDAQAAQEKVQEASRPRTTRLARGERG